MSEKTVVEIVATVKFPEQIDLDAAYEFERQIPAVEKVIRDTIQPALDKQFKEKR